MVDPIDHVALYAQQLGWSIRRRTVIVEGSSDAALLELAAKLERDFSGFNLIGSDLAVVAAGDGENGGTRGVTRELIRLTGYARTLLDDRGRPRYRFAALFDNDTAGRNAVRGLSNIDSSLLEYKDMFRLQPEMPLAGNLDPKTLRNSFEKLNQPFKGLDWELEDLIAENFMQGFEEEHPEAVQRRRLVNGRVHRDLSRDGKSQLHRFAHQNCIRKDLEQVVRTVHAMRFFMGLPPALPG